MLLLKNHVFLSIIAALVVYAIAYRTTSEEKEEYRSSVIMYAVLAGAFAYIGLRSFAKSAETAPPPLSVDTNTKVINGENVMVAPYSST